MLIPKNAYALGQDVPTTFENANHFWTYESFAYHFWQKPLIFSRLSNLTLNDSRKETISIKKLED